jgi:predicted amino acid dehydrogenase
MTKVRTIACLSLQSTPAAGEGYAELPGGPIRWQVIPCPANLEQVREELPRLLRNFDAVSLEGITSTFRIAGERFRHDYIWRYLHLQENYHRISDGSGLKAVLERHLVKQAADELGRELQGKRILFLCGLSRYGSAEVLSSYARDMIFGDLLYGYRIGIPIVGFHALVSAAPALLKTIAATPAQWFWPSTRPRHTLGPKHFWLFRGADVVVGDIVYFTRYAPPSLKGKIVFTSIYSDEDLAIFRKRQASKVVSLSPFVGGQYIPASVLGAAFKLDCINRPPDEMEDHYIDCIQKLQLEPVIYDLAEEDKPELAGASMPISTEAQVTPAAKAEVELQAGEAGKFCFVIHPLSFKYMKRIKSVRIMSRFLPARWIEDIAAHIRPFPVAAIRNVVSKTGATAEGLLYGVPMTSKAILRYPPEFLYQRLLRIADMAQEKGCRIMGLGAFTSVVGDAGLTVSRRSPIGVTSGNSFTVAATLKTLKTTAEHCGIDLKRAAALVVGATGSIGSICARLLADEVAELYLVSPRPERLLSLARQIEAESPQIAGHLRLSRHASHFLPLADVIITTTSTVDPVVDVTDLKPGCVVCDVARPPDIKEEAAAARQDILVIESGEIKLPDGADMKYDIGLPPGTIYACLAETILLALERKFGHYTIGREIDPARVREIAAIGEKHGFELAEIRSFGRVVQGEQVARLRAINAQRFTPMQAGTEPQPGHQPASVASAAS